MIYLQFLFGFLLYICVAYISYSKGFKSSPYYYAVGLLLAIGANFLWLWISKVEHDSSKLLIKGLLWDAMLTMTYFVVPLALFNARLNSIQVIGVLFLITGLILIKV